MEVLSNYSSIGYFDEAVDGDGKPRLASSEMFKHINKLGYEELKNRQKIAEKTIAQMGISFTVYSDKGNIDRLWPFDLVPRTIEYEQWQQVTKGLIQRLDALNLFIEDIYNDQAIIKDGLIPPEVILSSKDYREECKGMKLKHHAWACICGSDLVIDDKGEFYVLEDNLRVPSGVSYMLENRSVSKTAMPEAFEDYKHSTDAPIPLDFLNVALNQP